METNLPKNLEELKTSSNPRARIAYYLQINTIDAWTEALADSHEIVREKAKENLSNISKNI